MPYSEDTRRSLSEVLASYTARDVLLINVPSRWYRPIPALYPITTEHLLQAENDFQLLGDQDHEPNHGLLLLCSVLRENLISFDLLDLHTLCYLSKYLDLGLDIDSIYISVIQRVNPRIIAFSSMLPNFPFAVRLATLSKEALPDTTLIIGGAATVDIHHVLSTCIFDFAVIGESEISFPLLIRHVLTPSSDLLLSDISNIAYLNTNKQLHTTTHTPIRGQPDLLPAYDLLPRELPLIPRVYLSRGCGNRCGFCSPAYYFKNQFRIRHHKAVFSDICNLHNLFDFSWYNIGDLTFPINYQESLRLLKLLSESDFRPWWCQTQVSKINTHTAYLLFNAGCRAVALGFEDFFTKDAAISRKNVSKNASQAACEALREFGITVQGYWLFGLPDDTFSAAMQRIADICEMIRRDLVNIVHISYYVPYPGTPHYNHPDITICHTDFISHTDNEGGFYNALPMHHTNNLTRQDIFLLYTLAVEASTSEILLKQRYSPHV